MKTNGHILLEKCSWDSTPDPVLQDEEMREGGAQERRRRGEREVLHTSPHLQILSTSLVQGLPAAICGGVSCPLLRGYAVSNTKNITPPSQ